MRYVVALAVFVIWMLITADSDDFWMSLLSGLAVAFVVLMEADRDEHNRRCGSRRRYY